MSKLDFEVAKLLKTLGLKKYAEILWNHAEASVKEKKWNGSQFTSLYKTYHNSLSNSLIPKGDTCNDLIEKQIYTQSSEFLDTFGFTILRNFLLQDEVKTIDDLLNNLRSATSDSKTLFFSPLEKSDILQNILIHGPLLKTLKNIIGPFWFLGTDAAVETNAFPLHRDTFFNPPFYKIFIPTQPSIFQLLCGSHHVFDEYSKTCGAYVSDWDKPSHPASACSSIFFDHISNDRKIVGYDDSQKNPPLINIPLSRGDIFIFNQNAVHGLQPTSATSSFLAISVAPAPENAKKYNMTRSDHLACIIKSVACQLSVERELAEFKLSDSLEVQLPTRAFTKDKISDLLNDPELKNYFGFATISLDEWDREIRKNAHLGWEMIRNNL